MKLTVLAKDLCPADTLKEYADLEVSSLVSDSRKVCKGSLFVALKGESLDGKDFVQEAVEKGASLIVGQGKKFSGKTPFLPVDDPKSFLERAAKRFYADVSPKVNVLGITGTNGKTTIGYLLESIFEKSGRKCGVIGTVDHRIGKKHFPSLNTTPGLIENYEFFAEVARQGGECCVMEVSSHGLDQGRVEGVDFKSAVFTNLTVDHLDYHKTLENYSQAKAKLFTGLSSEARSIINADDPYGPKLKEMTRSKVSSYGIEEGSDFQAIGIQSDLSGLLFKIRYAGESSDIYSSLIGKHNVYNILAAFAAAYCEGIDPEIIKQGIRDLKGVPGRLERIDSSRGIHVFVDYAHTEDALNNVLCALRSICESRIILVFGCGGDRDRTKRPKMGEVADRLADEVILTNDNPRSEDPQKIVDQIKGGLSKVDYEIILDRKRAIYKALSIAQAGDVVLVAGKGHEDYQILGDQKICFDDKEVIREYEKNC